MGRDRKLIFNKYLYFISLLIPLFLTLFYGENLTVNIGDFTSYGNFGFGMDPLFIFGRPFLVSLSYCVPYYLAIQGGLELKRAKIYKFLIVIGFVLTIYLICITSIKDINHLLNPDYLLNQPPDFEAPGLLERIHACIAIFLAFVMFVSFIYLYRPIVGYKKILILFLSIIVLIGVSSIIYSLIVEFDSYEHIIGQPIIFDKDYTNFPHSFFDVGNVYGHVLYCGVLSLLMISAIINKRRYAYLSLFFVPFIYFSCCRAAIYSTLVIYGLYIFVCYVVSFKKSKIRFGIYTALLFTTIFIILADMFVFNWFSFTVGEKTYNSLDFVVFVLNELFSDRIIMISNILKNATIFDYIFGLGFGNQYFVTRSYGFIYYFHNTFVETLMTGGIFYFFFNSCLIIATIVKCYKMRHSRLLLQGVIWTMLVSHSLYSFSESFVPGLPNFCGGFYALMFFVFPEMMYEERKLGYQLEFHPVIRHKPEIPVYEEEVKKVKPDKISEIIVQNQDDFYLQGTTSSSSLRKPIITQSVQNLNTHPQVKHVIHIHNEYFMFEKEKYATQIEYLKHCEEYFESVAKKYKIYEMNVYILYGLKYKTFLNSHSSSELRNFNSGHYIKGTRSFYICADELIKLIDKK